MPWSRTVRQLRGACKYTRDAPIAINLTLAKKTGRTKSFLAREAIIHHLDDLEDYHLALARLRRDGKRMSLDELDAEIGAEKR